MKISDQLRQLADEYDAMNPGSGEQGNGYYEPGHVLKDTGPAMPSWSAGAGDDIVCTEDYWVRGKVGCMKGAHLSDYSTASIFAYKLMGEVPYHLMTVATRELGPPGATGSQLLASVADAGWMNGRNYRPRNPPGQNYADWCACGRPSANAFGKYDNRGEYKTEGSFSPGSP
jgi:hypothetical protein